MTKTARTTAIAAFTLACAAATPAAWASAPKGHQEGSRPQQSASGDSRAGDDGEHNPPGNNGFVKIHQVGGDTSPHNVPHVTCDFYISFFGFDTDQTADLTLSGQAPTGKGTELWSKDAALISTDDAGGGHDVDNEIHVAAAELGLDRLGDPHPKQGYHLKLDVDVNGAPGGEKHKVFWVEPCETAGAVSGTTGSVGDSTEGTTGENGGVLGAGDTTDAVPGTVPNSGGVSGTETSTTPGAEVLGVEFTRDSGSSASAGVLGESLPFTGVPLVGLAAGAALVAGAGVLMVKAGRRRASDV